MRFVEVPGDEIAARTQASFGYEWSHFHDWEPSGEQNFNDYFEGVNFPALSEAVVLEAGCGMGRHARYMADRVGYLVVVDFSAAVDHAARNLKDRANVDCVQADLTALPFEDGSFDYAYSIGVLHHLVDTGVALRKLVQKVRIEGRVRVYLYWKRCGLAGTLLRAVTMVRRATTRIPFPLLRAVCWGLSVVLAAGVVWPYRLMTSMGVRAHQRWPLFVYTKYPFRVLYNDQFDRFSAPVEQRFTREECLQLLADAGVDDVQIYPRYGWVAEGVRVR